MRMRGGGQELVKLRPFHAAVMAGKWKSLLTLVVGRVTAYRGECLSLCDSPRECHLQGEGI